MQTIGYIQDNTTGEKILILVRQGKDCVYLKRRKSGKEGSHFTGEEEYLNLPGIPEKQRLEDLKSGKVVRC